ncbi:MAG: hypothetical protein WD824_06060 [Cyclobacteriaceae bacterium]
MRIFAKGSLLIIPAFIISISCKQGEQKDILLDVQTIVYKEPAEVEKIIGKADSVYTLQMMGKAIFCQLYKKHNIEIQYPDSLATDIIIYGPHGLPFNQTALSAFNLDYKIQHPSDYKKDRYIRWSDFEEFSAITFYNPKKDSLNNITDFNIFFKAKD